MTPFARRFLRAVAAAFPIGAAAFLLPVASAGAAFVSFNACDNSALSQPFSQWLDYDQYKLAPYGDFETTVSQWSLQGGAAKAGGSEPFGVSGSVGEHSLSLPSGAVATSPPTCVNAAYPSFRFFVRTATPGSQLAVSVVYGDSTIPVGTLTLGGDWAPTPPMLTMSAIPGLVNGGTANVSLQFTQLSGSSQIDDVYVDPWSRG